MISQLESLVREGRFASARELLREVNLADIPRQERRSYANLAGRLGDLATGLRILNPVIRAEVTAPSATPHEVLQYANLLRKSGAVEEAIELIQDLGSVLPDARLQLAFCYQSQWRYGDAADVLTSLVDDGGLDAYGTLVAKVNLLACRVHEENFGAAAELVAELESRLEGGSSRLLFTNVLELAAQSDLRQQRFDSAFTRLEKAAALIGAERDSVSAMFIEKWIAIGRSLQRGRLMPELEAVEHKAARMRHWETLRDCAYYKAVLTGDEATLLRLYFGTPYADFRSRIKRAGVVVPESWILPGTCADAPVFDLCRATSDDRSVSLQPGQSNHRLLVALTQDLYRPLPLVTIFARLFSDEHFDPDSSPNRVHQVLKRFRKNPLKIRVEEIDGSYRLIFAGAGVRIPRERLPLAQKELEFRRMRDLLQQGTFSTVEATRALGASRSSVQRLLQWAAEAGKIEAQSKGLGTRYRFVA